MNKTKQQHVALILPPGGKLVVEVESQTEQSKLTNQLSAEQLKEWRKNKQLTQGKLAELLGVKITAVGRWESTERPIPPYLWLALVGLETMGADNMLPPAKIAEMFGA